MNEISNTGIDTGSTAVNNGIANANAFIQKMKDDSDFRNHVAPMLATIAEGDWSAVVSIAQQSGFAFGPEDLKRATPPSFYKGAGQNPDSGWQKEA